MKFARLFCVDLDRNQDFLFFVLEAPRDRDHSLEHYITAHYK